MALFVVHNLRETYHELGQFEFKVIVNPRIAKTAQALDISVCDSDGRPIAFEARRWGTKLRCKITIDETVSDGVAQAIVSIKRENGSVTREMFQFWVVK